MQSSTAYGKSQTAPAGRPASKSPADAAQRTASPRAASALDVDFDDPRSAFQAKDDTDLRTSGLVFRALGMPWLTNLGVGLTRAGLALRVPLVEWALKKTVFRIFCGGTSLEEAQKTAEKLYSSRVRSILDYAVEGAKTEEGFENTKDNLVRTVRHSGSRGESRFCALKMTGLAPFELLERKHAGQPLTAEELAAWDRVVGRVEEVAAAAAEVGVSVFFDAEESWIQGPVDALAEELMDRYNRGEAVVVHTTAQLYLRDRLPYLERLIARARARGFRVGVKLVRGAYLDKENRRAADEGYPSPTQPTKEATDYAYNRAVSLCIDNIDCVCVCAATHNIESVKHLLAEMEYRGIRPDDPRVEFSQLLGMLDRITVPLAQKGYNSSKYVPYGAVRDVVPYLIRRADENKSVAAQTAEELALIRQELKRRKQSVC